MRKYRANFVVLKDEQGPKLEAGASTTLISCDLIDLD